MKKVYSKPEIIFEDFALSTNIAGTCAVDTNLPSNPDGCGYLPEGAPQVIFLTGMAGCIRQFKDEEYNGICYHVPNETNDLFNS